MRRTKKYLKQIVNDIENDLSTVNRNIIKQTEEIEKQNALQKEKLEWEKETKDRVDISLKEYQEMKNKIEYLEKVNNKNNEIYKRLHLSEYVDSVITASVVVSTMKDPSRLTTRVNIQFDCANLFEHENKTTTSYEIEKKYKEYKSRLS